LVIKTISSYYRYPLKKTPLNLILDKYFLINKIYDLEEETKYKPHISFTIKEGNSEIDIFFDYQTFDLIGWRTKDIFQNINTTFISSIRKNQFIDKNLFSLPAPN
jgi:outer membrane lipoprotein-sorting protein